MSGLHRTALGLGLVAGLSLACADRLADLDEELMADEMPACLWVSGYGEWDDGSKHVLSNEQGLTSTVCMCMSPEEQWYLVHENEQAFIEHEINALALAECERVAGLYDFDWDPCQDHYAAGDWRVGLAFDTFEDGGPIKNREGLTCGEGDDDPELGCALGDRRPAAPGLLALVGLLALRRRRAREA